MISKLSASLLQWSTLLPTVIEECLHNSLSLIPIHNIERFSGLGMGMRKWLTKSPRAHHSQASSVVCSLVCIQCNTWKTSTSVCIILTTNWITKKGARPGNKATHNGVMHILFSCSLWPAYKLTMVWYWELLHTDLPTPVASDQISARIGGIIHCYDWSRAQTLLPPSWGK